ncbi:MAG: hypothetical protein M0Z32_04895 [Actinomycetota bacterium]|nr:hypothetical protein [Actinomycetota bacterium]MCL6094167.1 hypothetical protein [Actinomycetota bacterium]MDA8167076.1 hypothetical protein [Actinomycetota bacterium]
MNRRTYTTAEKEEALALYADVGPAEAGRQTGIPKATIRKWAHRSGLTNMTPVTSKKTQAANEANRVRNEARREEVKEKLLARIDLLLERMTAPQIDFKGQQARRVEYPVPPAKDTLALATGVGILLDKLRLEEGKAPPKAQDSGEQDHSQVGLWLGWISGAVRTPEQIAEYLRNPEGPDPGGFNKAMFGKPNPSPEDRQKVIEELWADRDEKGEMEKA